MSPLRRLMGLVWSMLYIQWQPQIVVQEEFFFLNTCQIYMNSHKITRTQPQARIVATGIKHKVFNENMN